MSRTLQVSIVILAAAGCSEGPGATNSPTDPSAPAQPVFSAPVQGTVRAADGAPLAGALVTSYYYGNFTGVTDESGRFSFASDQVDGRISRAQIRVYCPGFFGAYRDVPLGTGEAPPQALIDISMHPRDALIEDRPIETVLTNADPDYGHDSNIQLGLPGARGPVKIIAVQPRTSGPVEVRAEWTDPDRLRMWVEKDYMEVSMEAIPAPRGENVLTLRLPAGWAIDAMNDTVITIGLPRSARATGGLSRPVPIRLSVTPVR